LQTGTIRKSFPKNHLKNFIWLAHALHSSLSPPPQIHLFSTLMSSMNTNKTLNPSSSVTTDSDYTTQLPSKEHALPQKEEIQSINWKLCKYVRWIMYPVWIAIKLLWLCSQGGTWNIEKDIVLLAVFDKFVAKNFFSRSNYFRKTFFVVPICFLFYRKT
jgi:hypothetical protein